MRIKQVRSQILPPIRAGSQRGSSVPPYRFKQGGSDLADLQVDIGNHRAGVLRITAVILPCFKGICKAGQLDIEAREFVSRDRQFALPSWRIISKGN